MYYVNKILKLTHNIQITHLALHRISVDLAHIVAAIRFAYVLQFQLPLLALVDRDTDAMVFRNDVILDGQNGLRFYAKPGDFERSEIVDDAREHRLASNGCCYVQNR